MMKALKIVNAQIPCFEDNTWKVSDILVDEGKIVKLGTVMESAQVTIDAEGKIVSPGFIDIHAHEDSISNKEFPFFTAECALRMGVTTQAAGNCGESADDLGDFCQYIQRNGSPVNYVMFVGQNSLRHKAGALDWYKATEPAQLDRMKKMLEECLEFAPVGLSCGFEYEPGVTAEETIRLAEVFGGDNHVISVHFRRDGEGSKESIDELAYIQRETGLAMQMSHIGSCSATGYMKEALSVLRTYREEGVDIMADCYPYNAFCTGIKTAVFDDGCFEKWNKGYEDLLITDGKYKNRRCTAELFRELREGEEDVRVVAFVMNDDEIEEAYRQPFVMVGSDCGYTNGGGHPRGAGTFPRVLGKLVREKKVITLLDALRKMTIQPAERLGLQYKGAVREGMDADLVIFGPDTISDRADFLNPSLPPEGIDYVVVNGRIAVRENRIIDGRSGRYIRHMGK